MEEFFGDETLSATSEDFEDLGKLCELFEQNEPELPILDPAEVGAYLESLVCSLFTCM